MCEVKLSNSSFLCGHTVLCVFDVTGVVVRIFSIEFWEINVDVIRAQSAQGFLLYFLIIA